MIAPPFGFFLGAHHPGWLETADVPLCVSHARLSGVIPVIQGWTYPSYFMCIDLYEKAGVDLTREPLVGVGSICRRPSLRLPTMLLADLAQAGFRIHAFGFKKAGLRIAAKSVVSADSLAWSYGGRHEPGCSDTHQQENNCMRHALWWRQDLLDHIADDQRRHR